MRSTPRARRLLAALVAALFLPALPILPAGASPTPLASSPVDLSLWLHADDTLSMAGNANDPPAPSSATTRDWVMADGLHKDLCIDGVDIGGGRQGFAVTLPVGFSTFTALNITVDVRDETYVIANGTFPFGRGAPPANTVWNLNFTANRTGCTVLKGHKLAVEFSSANTLLYGDFRNAHLALRATDPVQPDSHTENSLGPSGAFYPNDVPGNRDLLVVGALNNAFTDPLIQRVLVQVRDPAGTPVNNGNATVSQGNYTYTWSYPPSPAGTYTAWVEVDDTQGHSYNTSTTFKFVDYGLRIQTQDQSGGAATRYTTQGVGATYELTVTNIGGQPTVVLLVTSTSPPPGWTANFSVNSIPLAAGASTLTVLTVTPAPSIGPGNSTQITVIAQAQDDPSPLKARATLATTTIIYPEISITISPPRTDATVKLGGQASYNFTITNQGGLATDITFNATSPPTGWDRTMAGTGLVVEGDHWRLVGLEANGTRTMTLIVYAPVDSNGTTTFDCTVTARSVANASAVATFVGSTRLQLGIELLQTSLPIKPQLLPGAFEVFDIEVTNTDPLVDHNVTTDDVSVTENASNPQSVRDSEGGSIVPTGPLACCKAGKSDTISVTVTLPPRAKAGTYKFNVEVRVDGDPNRKATIEISLLVLTVTSFSLRLTGRPTQMVLNEGKGTVGGALVNDGNAAVVVDIAFAVMAGSRADATWSVRLLGADGLEVPSRFTLQAYSQIPVNLTVDASPLAFNGDRRDLTVSLSRAPTGADAWQLAPPLQLVVQLSSGTVLTRMWQQSSAFMIVFVGLALIAAAGGRRALRGPKAPPPRTAPKAPAGGPGKPAAQGGGEPRAPPSALK